MPRHADLHLHTYHSDGVRSPREVVDLARHNGLEIIAISDHDNLAAYFEIRDYAREHSVTLIPGVELSCGYQGLDIHILAYAFDPADGPLNERLVDFREARLRRGEAMVDRLVTLGYAISRARVAELCGTGAMGRPHIARALLEIGAVSSIEDAFQKLLGSGCPGYVEKERFAIEEAVAVIRAAGGVTSIAHPTVYPRHRAVVEELFEAGVDGVEALHPNVDDEQRRYYERLAHLKGKLVTGGSDDHGFGDRCTIGTVRVSAEMIGPILDRLADR
ncbi:MAG TPA: PHP domain-containing protein [Thermoanaerobaculia bacterium]